MKTLQLKIRGKAPLLMQAGTLANPMHPLSKQIKEITSLRKKTDEDLIEILRLKYMGSLYWHEKDGPYLPGENLYRALWDASKELKLGKRFTQDANVLEDRMPLKYDGPREPDALYQDMNFVDTRMVTIGKAKVAMSRPIFKAWACEATLVFNPERLDERDVRQIISVVGRQSIGTFRRRFGKFDVEVA